MAEELQPVGPVLTRAVPTERPRLSLVVDCEPGIELDLSQDDGAAWLERVGAAAIASSGALGNYEVALLIAGDETLQRLNRDFRSVDRPTDVLSFSQHEGDASTIFTAPPQKPDVPLHLGDVALSLERARHQAEEYGHSVQREVAYLLTHGVLHLLGYDHEGDAEQQRMRLVEEAALSAMGLPRP